jgi:hypothetical protein
MPGRPLPYAIAHDQPGAGLRDYLPISTGDSPPPRRGWLLVALFVIVGLGYAAAVYGR